MQARMSQNPVMIVPDALQALQTLRKSAEQGYAGYLGHPFVKSVFFYERMSQVASTTHKDPFVGKGAQIMSWLVANPERSIVDIFRELQRRSPGRYQPLQIRTLQRGMRKMRAYLLESFEEQWQAEVIHG